MIMQGVCRCFRKFLKDVLPLTLPLIMNPVGFVTNGSKFEGCSKACFSLQMMQNLLCIFAMKEWHFTAIFQPKALQSQTIINSNQSKIILFYLSHWSFKSINFIFPSNKFPSRSDKITITVYLFKSRLFNTFYIISIVLSVKNV